MAPLCSSCDHSTLHTTKEAHPFHFHKLQPINTVNLNTFLSALEFFPHLLSLHLTKQKEKMGGVIAPSASVTGTSVLWQILFPVGLHSSTAGRHPLQTAHTETFPRSTPPSPPLESIHCCSRSYYRYAPAKCKTSICHLSAQQLSPLWKLPIMPRHFSSISSTHEIEVYFWSIWGGLVRLWSITWTTRQWTNNLLFRQYINTKNFKTPAIH